ncbi:MAG TPA: SRPBCC domain-containing protein [Chitinophaga sp.]|uniref:SRPBCC family protein n=1 Tax=Chitinophaga sp. TaxID=1869181 RepID=UPI002BD259C8|nr:SRPBCC domain-containing protein [Chitinophaga sp.]HVI44270.1 SRPBCC domain-containing protein [Chitinophaga sp.]
MSSQDFTTVIVVDKTPEEAFNAINDVRGWWSGEIEGNTSHLDDEFSYRYKDLHYTRQKLVEVVPGKKVVWLITDSSLNFVADKTEWTGTKIIFDIEGKGDQTQIRFTHQGLLPAFECFDACSNAWTHYIQHSLREFITTGKGEPVN